MILKISLAYLVFLVSCGSEMDAQEKPEVIKQERKTPPPLPPKPPAKKLVKRRPLPPLPPKTVEEPSFIKALKDVLKKRRDRIEEDDESEEKEWLDD